MTPASCSRFSARRESASRGSSGSFSRTSPQERTVARGRCLPYGEGITFWPLLEAIRDVAGLDDTAPARRTEPDSSSSWKTIPTPELVAQRVIGDHGHGRSPHRRARKASTRCAGSSRRLGRRRALVVVFDDIHWAESTFLDLVEHLAERSRGAPILLLCMARPELLEVRPGWAGGKLNATTVLLEPLSDDECMAARLESRGGGRGSRTDWSRGSPTPRRATRCSSRRWSRC